MQQVRIQLKGWAAVPVALFFIGFLIYRIVAVKSTLASDAAEELEVWLRAEYSRQLLGEIDVKDLDRNRIDPRVQKLLDSRKVEIESISARGTDPIYVKATISVNGKEPPDGKSTRYYVMQYSALTGWRMRREISALSYYLRFF